MGKGRGDPNRWTGPDAYSMCKRKRKLKSSQAGKMADMFDQRKYRCPVCGQWHLTKQRIPKDEHSI